jgi:hypothetical protein
MERPDEYERGDKTLCAPTGRLAEQIRPPSRPVGFLFSPGSHRGRCQCSLPEFCFDGASRDGRIIAWLRWCRLVYRPWTVSKVGQNKIASDIAYKLSQRRRLGQSVESWHKDTIHLLEKYRRTTSVAYASSIAVDTLLTRLNLSTGSYAADKVLLSRTATVPNELSLLIEVNRSIASLYRLFSTYEHCELANPIFTPRRRTIAGEYSSQSPAVRGFPGHSHPTTSARVFIDTCVWSTPAIRRLRMTKTRRHGFPKKRSTPKQTGQNQLGNFQRKSDALSFYDYSLPGHIEADCTTDKRHAAALLEDL